MKLYRYTFLAITLLLANPAQAAQRLTLWDCYQKALEHSTDVAISEQDIMRARARYQQALGTLLPTIGLGASARVQDSAGAGSPFLDRTTRTVAFSAEQPLFQGFRELKAIPLAKLDKKLQSENLKNAKRLLFADVARVFYAIRSAETSLARDSEMASVGQELLKLAATYVKQGKSRESEQAGYEAQVALIQADVARDQTDIATGYEAMSFLTGLSPHPKLVEGGLSKKLPKTLNDYLAVINQRPDLAAAKAQADISKDTVVVTRSKLLPQASIAGNAYPYRTGYSKDVSWDTTLTVSVPLLNFGSIGDLKEQSAVSRQMALRREASERIALTEVKKSFEMHQGSRKRLFHLDTAASAARKALDLLKDEYRLGLANGTEVLQAQKTYLSTASQRDDARVNERLDWFALQTAAGTLP